MILDTVVDAGGDRAAPGSSSAPTRWGSEFPYWPASRAGTGSTCRSSTIGSIRRSRSCRSITTARSGWTVLALRDGGAGRAQDRFDIAFGNDPDTDRHGIVTRSGGLMNPNHYLAASIAYLFGAPRELAGDAGVGKTLVRQHHRPRRACAGGRLDEVPVGFKWFVPGCSTAPSASAARRARARASSATTAARGPPTRTALSCVCLPAEMTADGQGSGRAIRRARASARDPVYRGSTLRRRPAKSGVWRPLDPRT